MERNDYISYKNEITKKIELGYTNEAKEGFEKLKTLCAGSSFLDGDIDILWIDFDLKTNHFRNCISKKDVNSFSIKINTFKGKRVSSYAQNCSKLFEEYVGQCEKQRVIKKKKHKRTFISLSICLVVVSIAFVTLDRLGVLYGTKPIRFSAWGVEYVQADVVRYNSHAQINVPKQLGYDVAGIKDKNTGKMLFDSKGRSYSVVSNRDCSDFSNNELEVCYTPHVYTATLLTSNNIANEKITYTIENSPEVPDPQILPGYVFEGWFTDLRFTEPFSGRFSDYITESSSGISLYPKYTVCYYSISFDLDGGEFLNNNYIKNYSVLDRVDLPQDCDVYYKDGYCLAGWMLDGKLLSYFSPSIMSDVVLSAKWEPRAYKINIYDGIDGSMETKIVKYNSTYNLSSKTHPGYTFSSYNFENEIFPQSGTFLFTSDISIVSKFTTNIYTIQYDLCGGEFLNDSHVNSYSILDNVILPQDSDVYYKDGYCLAGWTFNGGLFTHFSPSIACNIILTAKWEPKTYKINIKDSVDGSSETKEIKYNSTYNFTPRSHSGYSFVDYKYNNNVFSQSSMYLFTEDITIVSTFKPNIYKMRIYDGLDGSIEVKEVEYNSFYVASSKTHPGYSFKNFKHGSDSFASSGNYLFSDDISIVANFTPNEYSITYVLNGGSTQENTVQKVKYNDLFETNIVPVKDSYEFIGWFTEDNSFSTMVKGGTYNTVGNIVLYAQYIKTMTINLSADKEYTIDNSIDKAYIKGNYNTSNTLIQNVKIKVQTRYTDLTINTINAGFKAPLDSVAINCENIDFTLTILNTGVTHIEGGNGSTTSGDGKAGCFAICCGNLIFDTLNSQSIKIIGGSGAKGHKGAAGQQESTAWLWLNYTHDGGRGYKAGDAGSALKIKSLVRYTTVTISQGSVGSGGEGGDAGWRSYMFGTWNGSKGAKGSDGSKVEDIIYIV